MSGITSNTHQDVINQNFEHFCMLLKFVLCVYWVCDPLLAIWQSVMNGGIGKLKFPWATMIR